MRTTSIAVIAACFVLTSCFNGPKVTETVIEGPDYVEVIDIYEITATIAAINPMTRQITLRGSDGSETTFKAGREAVNFDEVAVGDVVTAEVGDEVAISLIESGAPRSVGAAASVAVAPPGEKPAIVMAETVEVTATIRVVDHALGEPAIAQRDQIRARGLGTGQDH